MQGSQGALLTSQRSYGSVSSWLKRLQLRPQLATQAGKPLPCTTWSVHAAARWTCDAQPCRSGGQAHQPAVSSTQGACASSVSAFAEAARVTSSGMRHPGLRAAGGHEQGWNCPCPSEASACYWSLSLLPSRDATPQHLAHPLLWQSIWAHVKLALSLFSCCTLPSAALNVCSASPLLTVTASPGKPAAWRACEIPALLSGLSGTCAAHMLARSVRLA